MATKSREASDWTTPNRLCNVESLGEVILKIMQERESLSQGESVLQRRFPSSIYASCDRWHRLRGDPTLLARARGRPRGTRECDHASIVISHDRKSFASFGSLNAGRSVYTQSRRVSGIGGTTNWWKRRAPGRHSPGPSAGSACRRPSPLIPLPSLQTSIALSDDRLVLSPRRFTADLLEALFGRRVHHDTHASLHAEVQTRSRGRVWTSRR